MIYTQSTVSDQYFCHVAEHLAASSLHTIHTHARARKSKCTFKRLAYPACVFLECFAGSQLDLVLGHVLDDIGGDLCRWCPQVRIFRISIRNQQTNSLSELHRCKETLTAAFKSLSFMALKGFPLIPYRTMDGESIEPVRALGESTSWTLAPALPTPLARFFCLCLSYARPITS